MVGVRDHEDSVAARARSSSCVRTPRLPAETSAPAHSLVLHSKLVPYSNKYFQRHYFMLASPMTLALHPHPQAAISQIRLRAPLSSLALFHKSENQLSCFQFRAHDFVEMGGWGQK